MSGSSFAVRKMAPGDRPRVDALMEAVYGRAYDQSRWVWEYQNHPGGPAQIWLAEKDGKIVGMRPVLSHHLVQNGQEIPVKIYQNVMTHPDHRRKGVFSALTAAADRETEASGAPAITFPNARSFPAYRRQPGWHWPFNFPMMFRPVDARALLTSKLGKTASKILSPLASPFIRSARSTPTTPLGQIVIEEFESFGPEAIDLLSEDMVDDKFIRLKKDVAYLDWRYIARPDQKYNRLALVGEDGRWLGFVVFTVLRQFGLSLGFLCDIALRRGHNELAGAIIAAAEERLAGSGVAALGCMIKAGSVYCRALRERGWFPLPERLMGRSFPLMVRQSEKPSLRIDFTRDLYLICGDWDLV